MSSHRHKGLPRLFDYASAVYGFDPDTQVIISDDIQEGIDRRPDRVWTAADFPNLSPIFDSFFIESFITMPPEMGLGSDAIYWQGLHFLERTADVKGLYFEKAFKNFPPGVRWIYQCIGYAKIGTFQVMHFPGVMFLHVGERGEWLDNPENINLFTSIDEQPIVGQHVLPAQMMDMIPTALTALALMNSETIVLQPHEGNQKPPKDTRYRTGKPGVRYYTLNILPPRVRRESIYASPHDGSTPARAAHFRHGKWKSYNGTPGHMFMGKYARPMSFFVPGHAVGERENGEVKKKYKIKVRG